MSVGSLTLFQIKTLKSVFPLSRLRGVSFSSETKRAIIMHETPGLPRKSIPQESRPDQRVKIFSLAAMNS